MFVHVSKAVLFLHFDSYNFLPIFHFFILVLNIGERERERGGDTRTDTERGRERERRTERERQTDRERGIIEGSIMCYHFPFPQIHFFSRFYLRTKCVQMVQ